jgi:hypothetical protein
MRITKEIEMRFTEMMPHMCLNDRRDRAEYYRQYPMGRRDIACVQFMDVANVFIEVDVCGNVFAAQVDLFPGVNADDEGKIWLKFAALREFHAKAPTYYAKAHAEFFKSLRP